MSMPQVRLMRAIRPQLFPSEKAITDELHAQNIKAAKVETGLVTIDDKNYEYALSDFKQKVSQFYNTYLICYQVTEIAEILLTAKILKPQQNTIRLKISGDGYKSSCKSGQVMWCFTLLDLDHPHGQLATWEFAIVDASEDHATLLAVARKFRSKIEELTLNGLVLEGKHYTIDLYLSADQKFLHVILGLKGAAAKFLCIWCTITKTDRGSVVDMNKVKTLLRNLLNLPLIGF